MEVKKRLCPCEYCGSINVDVYRSPLTNAFTIECEDCWAATGPHGTVEEAADEWNDMQIKKVEERNRKRCGR